MSQTGSWPEGYRALWTALFRPAAAAGGGPELRAAAERLAAHILAPLAAALLEPAASRLGGPLLDPARIEAERLAARFLLAAQLKCLRAVARSGIDAVALKGFANAHTLYPAPELRLFGDLDLLIRRADLDRLIAALGAAGYRFRPARGPAWGFIAEGSFPPFVSPDEGCNLDIHLDPDSFPINRALTAERVFAAARALTLGDLTVLVPSPTHALLLCISNAAKDKFGPYSVRKLIDGFRLLQGPAPDWIEACDVLARGRLTIAARTFLALPRRLGAPLPAVPPALAEPPGGPRAAEFERLVDSFAALFPDRPHGLAVMRREIMLCTTPGAALRLNGRRLIGLIRPRSGVPAGLTAAA